MAGSDVLARLAQLEAQLSAATAKIAQLEDALAAAPHGGGAACGADASGEEGEEERDALPSSNALLSAAPELSHPDMRPPVLPMKKPQSAKRGRSASPPPRRRAATPPPPALPSAVKAEHAESELESLLRHYTVDKVSVSAGEAQQVMATRGGFSRARFARF